MKVAKPTDSARKCARATRWANAVLLRLAAWIVNIAGLSAPVERAVARAIEPFLNKMAMLISAIITVKALALNAPLRPIRKGGRPRSRTLCAKRVLFGSRLRHLAKARDPRARIAALARMLNTLDAHVTRMARRLKNGLTRRMGGFKREARALPLAVIAIIGAIHADTS